MKYMATAEKTAAADITSPFAKPIGFELFLKIQQIIYKSHVSTSTPVTKYAGILRYILLIFIFFP
jgi:hypothetical protein